jgi:hypothetical protein
MWSAIPVAEQAAATMDHHARIAGAWDARPSGARIATAVVASGRHLNYSSCQPAG